MRILHVIDQTVRYNGMVHAAIDLACAQAAIGHDVAICRGGGEFDDVLGASGVAIHTIRKFSMSPAIVLSAADLFGVIRRFKPDVVHAHMVASAILAWPLTRILRVPLITCVQNSFSKHATLMRLGDRVITGCNAVAKTMVERGIPWKKLRPILNGTLGSARLPTRDAPEMTLQRPAVVTVCGLHPRKGVPDLITAFESVRARDPRLHLYIVGEGPYEAAYKRLVSDDNRANVHFVGPLHDPRPYLKGADLFVLASLADPAPLVLPEAREAGLAVIATNVDGIPELLENGAAGILVRPSAPDELAARMAELFADTAKLQHWRVNSQINLAYLSVRRVAEQTVEVYRECIA